MYITLRHKSESAMNRKKPKPTGTALSFVAFARWFECFEYAFVPRMFFTGATFKPNHVWLQRISKQNKKHFTGWMDRPGFLAFVIQNFQIPSKSKNVASTHAAGIFLKCHLVSGNQFP